MKWPPWVTPAMILAAALKHSAGVPMSHAHGQRAQSANPPAPLGRFRFGRMPPLLVRRAHARSAGAKTETAGRSSPPAVPETAGGATAYLSAVTFCVFLRRAPPRMPVRP